MGDAHHCSGPPDSEMTYTVSSGTLNSTIPYHYENTCSTAAEHDENTVLSIVLLYLYCLYDEQ